MVENGIQKLLWPLKTDHFNELSIEELR
jgi:hypothetical protein